VCGSSHLPTEAGHHERHAAHQRLHGEQAVSVWGRGRVLQHSRARWRAIVCVSATSRRISSECHFG
jgi:hypothetical protein